MVMMMPRLTWARITRGPGLAILALTALGGVSVPLNAAISPDPPMAELWIQPPATRDLVFGVGGRRLMPDPHEVFTVTEIKASGYSDGYKVVDGSKREWSAKFPPEASPEIVASRLLWGIGFHQPPAYLLSEWRAVGADDPNPQRSARFREKKPDLYGLTDKGAWSYADNPFVGTRPLNGLLVFQVLLGNSDLKDSQNAMYELDRPFEGASRWYVARDLGQTLGRTGLIDAPRGDIDVFEKTPFIRSVTEGHVVFEYHGRHQDLIKNISVADVEWVCRRLMRLSDRQWQDAFRAGGYGDPLAARFITRIRAKVAEGLALASSERRRS
jgi:hypothetical protein